MSQAEIENVDPDIARARDFVLQARRFLSDAERHDTSLESAVVLYYQACLSLMDGVLAAAGRRVGSGTESHVVRIRETARLLGQGYRELTARLDEWRRERGAVSYAALTPPAGDVAALREDTLDLLAATERFLGKHSGA